IVDSVFGKGENIKIALKHHLENKNAPEETKEVKFPFLKPQPTTETTAEMKEKETKEAVGKALQTKENNTKEVQKSEVKEKETKENDTKEVQETQPKEAPTALQEFMANHSE
ncbi:DNA polymerase III subunit gamma/tau, partial [Helicobacter pylori]